MCKFTSLSQIVDGYILSASMRVWVVCTCTHTRLPDGYMILPICVTAGRDMFPYPASCRVIPVGYPGFGIPKAQELITKIAICSPDEQGFSLHRGLIKYKNKVWIANNSALQTRLLTTLHSSAIGGHSRSKVTYQRLKKLFYCKGMKGDVENFVKQCAICEQVSMRMSDGHTPRVFMQGRMKTNSY
jgi:hypothetical protein